MMANYHAHLLGEVKAKRLTNTYAKELLTTSKAIVRWLWEQEAIDNLPRNLNKLKIEADTPTIKTLTIEEAKILIKEATDRQRLYTLLMAKHWGDGQRFERLETERGELGARSYHQEEKQDPQAKDRSHSQLPAMEGNLPTPQTIRHAKGRPRSTKCQW